MIAPAEIREKRFRTTLMGYPSREVDAFISLVSEEVERLTDEVIKLNEEVRRVSGDLALYKGREESVIKTMMTSQKVCDDMKKNAENESQIILSEAELKADKIVAVAEQRLLKIGEEITEMRRQKIKFEEALRSLLTTHFKLLDVSREEA